VYFFYIAIAETRYLEDIFSKLSEYDDFFRKNNGIRIGALVRFTKWKKACTPCKLADKYNVPLFIDNGAFDYLTKSQLDAEAELEFNWRKWLMEYASFMSNWYSYVTAAAMPDVPVHGREFLPPSYRMVRIMQTATFHAKFAALLRRLEPAALEKMIVVLQGYTVKEYAASLEEHMKNKDILSDTLSFNPGREPYGGVFGVGSVCVRKPSSKGKTALLADGRAAGTLKQFMKEFLTYGWPENVRGFHFFGLHTDAVRLFANSPRYYASDTGAHGLNYRYKWRTVLGCKKPDAECYSRAIESQIRLTLSPFLSKQLTR